jgi:putative transposase
MPKVVYDDNGRAFNANYFTNTDDIENIVSLFDRLGIKTINAIPYHGQSKTIERFFRTFAELERMMPTYCGTSIELQPPRMNRGEKLHNKLYDKMITGTSMNIFQAHQVIAAWFDKYSARIQQEGHLKGKCPAEIFNAGKGPGVDKHELTFLMMAHKVTTVYRNGIKMFNTHYWNEALFGQQWDEVLVRYDLLDNDSIFVYDKNGEFICEAMRIDKVHPAAGILGTEEDVKQLHDQLARKQSLKNLIVGDAKRFLSDEVYPAAKKQFSEINLVPIAGEEIPVVQETQQKSKPRRKNLLDSWENANIEPKQNRAAEA